MNVSHTNPLVSVIIPNYNHSRYLDQRIQSVLSQTYKCFEVIILDDKSTDNSLEVIRKYETEKRITSVIANEHNSGNTFIQWNKGMKMAKGELVWIAESDDYCEPTLLEELVKAYQSHGDTVLAYSTLVYVDDSGDEISRRRVFPNQFFKANSYLRRYLLRGNMISNASCAVFNRERAIACQADYMQYLGSGDYLFWAELISGGGHVAIVNKNLSYFRRHTGVVTERRYFDGTNFKEDKRIYDKIRQVIHVTGFRKWFTSACHIRGIRAMRMASEEMRQELFQLWGGSDRPCFVERIVFKIDKYLVRFCNYYL